MLSNVCDWLYYLTKPFGQDAFSVRWYARVRGHELVTRRDLLPDEPDHPRAEQRYYKLQLGKLVELPYPIPSRRLRRITFVLTNGKRLNEAWEINDLFLGPREQDLLWRARSKRCVCRPNGTIPSEKRMPYIRSCYPVR